MVVSTLLAITWCSAHWRRDQPQNEQGISADAVTAVTNLKSAHLTPVENRVPAWGLQRRVPDKLPDNRPGMPRTPVDVHGHLHPR